MFILNSTAVDNSVTYVSRLNLIVAFTKVTRINNSDYEVKLVDTAGQDEYSIFPAQYSMDFHGYVLVYSITSQKSFEVIKIIYEKLIDVMGKA
jgi:Ras homolog enriched in brain